MPKKGRLSFQSSFELVADPKNKQVLEQLRQLELRLRKARKELDQLVQEGKGPSGKPVATEAQPQAIERSARKLQRAQKVFSGFFTEHGKLIGRLDEALKNVERVRKTQDRWEKEQARINRSLKEKSSSLEREAASLRELERSEVSRTRFRETRRARTAVAGTRGFQRDYERAGARLEAADIELKNAKTKEGIDLAMEEYKHRQRIYDMYKKEADAAAEKIRVNAENLAKVKAERKHKEEMRRIEGYKGSITQQGNIAQKMARRELEIKEELAKLGRTTDSEEAKALNTRITRLQKEYDTLGDIYKRNHEILKTEREKTEQIKAQTRSSEKLETLQRTYAGDLSTGGRTALTRELGGIRGRISQTRTRIAEGSDLERIKGLEKTLTLLQKEEKGVERILQANKRLLEQEERRNQTARKRAELIVAEYEARTKQRSLPSAQRELWRLEEAEKATVGKLKRAKTAEEVSKLTHELDLQRTSIKALTRSTKGLTSRYTVLSRSQHKAEEQQRALNRSRNHGIRLGKDVLVFLSRWRNRILLTVFALGSLIRAIKQSIEEAKRQEAAFRGLISVSDKLGVSAQNAKAAAIGLTRDGLMLVSDAAKGLKNLLATGFSLDEAINLMRAFKDAAAFGRQGSLSFAEAITGATEGIKNQNSILVDNVGITKNLSVILKEAGLTQNDLMRVTTDASVRMALYNGLMKEATLFQGDAARMTDTLSGKLSALEAQFRRSSIALGEKLRPAIEEGITAFQIFSSTMLDLSENESLINFAELIGKLLIEAMKVLKLLITTVANIIANKFVLSLVAASAAGIALTNIMASIGRLVHSLSTVLLKNRAIILSVIQFTKIWRNESLKAAMAQLNLGRTVKMTTAKIGLARIAFTLFGSTLGRFVIQATLAGTVIASIAAPILTVVTVITSLIMVFGALSKKTEENTREAIKNIETQRDEIAERQAKLKMLELEAKQYEETADKVRELREEQEKLTEREHRLKSEQAALQIRGIPQGLPDELKRFLYGTTDPSKIPELNLTKRGFAPTIRAISNNDTMAVIEARDALKKELNKFKTAIMIALDTADITTDIGKEKVGTVLRSYAPLMEKIGVELEKGQRRATVQRAIGLGIDPEKYIKTRIEEYITAWQNVLTDPQTFGAFKDTTVEIPWPEFKFEELDIHALTPLFIKPVREQVEKQIEEARARLEEKRKDVISKRLRAGKQEFGLSAFVQAPFPFEGGITPAELAKAELELAKAERKLEEATEGRKNALKAYRRMMAKTAETTINEDAIFDIFDPKVPDTGLIYETYTKTWKDLGIVIKGAVKEMGEAQTKYVQRLQIDFISGAITVEKFTDEWDDMLETAGEHNKALTHLASRLESANNLTRALAKAEKLRNTVLEELVENHEDLLDVSEELANTEDIKILEDLDPSRLQSIVDTYAKIMNDLRSTLSLEQFEKAQRTLREEGFESAGQIIEALEKDLDKVPPAVTDIVDRLKTLLKRISKESSEVLIKEIESTGDILETIFGLQSKGIEAEIVEVFGGGTDKLISVLAAFYDEGAIEKMFKGGTDKLISALAAFYEEGGSEIRAGLMRDMSDLREDMETELDKLGETVFEANKELYDKFREFGQREMVKVKFGVKFEDELKVLDEELQLVRKFSENRSIALEQRKSEIEAKFKQDRLDAQKEYNAEIAEIDAKLLVLQKKLRVAASDEQKERLKADMADLVISYLVAYAEFSETLAAINEDTGEKIKALTSDTSEEVKQILSDEINFLQGAFEVLSAGIEAALTTAFSNAANNGISAMDALLSAALDAAISFARAMQQALMKAMVQTEAFKASMKAVAGGPWAIPALLGLTALTAFMGAKQKEMQASEMETGADIGGGGGTIGTTGRDLRSTTATGTISAREVNYYIQPSVIFSNQGDILAGAGGVTELGNTIRDITVQGVKESIETGEITLGE